MQEILSMKECTKGEKVKVDERSPLNIDNQQQANDFQELCFDKNDKPARNGSFWIKRESSGG